MYHFFLLYIVGILELEHRLCQVTNLISKLNLISAAFSPAPGSQSHGRTGLHKPKCSTPPDYGADAAVDVPWTLLSKKTQFAVLNNSQWKKVNPDFARGRQLLSSYTRRWQLGAHHWFGIDSFPFHKTPDLLRIRPARLP